MTANATTRQPFDLVYLYELTHNLSLPHEYVVQPYPNKSIWSITYDGCVSTVGNDINYYTRKDVYDRVILWKLPLLALWATTTLPPFSFHTQLFTLMHLIADPIDTTWSLLYKLYLAKRTAHWAKEFDGPDRRILSFPSNQPVGQADVAERDKINIMLEDEKRGPSLRRYFQDVPAMIITAYDEWGKGEEALEAFEWGL